MIDVSGNLPFIIKELADVAVVLAHRKLIARWVHASGADRLNLQTLHAHHLSHSFPKFFTSPSNYSPIIELHLKIKWMEMTEASSIQKASIQKACRCYFVLWVYKQTKKKYLDIVCKF
jgi:hypothetical protein